MTGSVHPCKIVALIIFSNTSDRGIGSAVIIFVECQIVIKDGIPVEASIGGSIVVVLFAGC